jgi:nucleotide-binding universal stress UspA family protein
MDAFTDFSGARYIKAVKPMTTALAFVDFSDATVTVVRMAREIARALGMKLILMHVSTPDADAEGREIRTDVSRHGIAVEMHRYLRELDLLALECTKLGVETTALLVRGRSSRGSPVRKMVSELKRVKPALIVMGTHQHGRLVQAMFGSASTRVIHKASCPILLIPSQNPSIEWIANSPKQPRQRGRIGNTSQSQAVA